METNGENSEPNSTVTDQDENSVTVNLTTTTTTMTKGSRAQHEPVAVESQSAEIQSISDSNGFSVESTVMDTSEDLSVDPDSNSTDLIEDTEPKNDDNVKPGEEKKVAAQSTSPDTPEETPQETQSEVKENPTTTSSSTTASGNQKDVSTPSAADSSSKSSKSGKRTRSIRSELDRLLMDEGTVKILMGRGSRSGGGGSTSDVTKEEKMNELQKNRDLAIQQVREGSTKLFRKVSLRQKSKYRKQQEQQKEIKSKKLKLESSSKIIRRRSSSSNFNFSSRSPSPLHPNAATYTSDDDPIQVRVQDSIGYITISAESFKFNSQTLSRLTSILNSMKLDDTVTLVQLTTTTNDFIQGLDVAVIQNESDHSLRESMADSMIACLDTLLKVLMSFPKILVAGVSGEAVDFGVLILTFFDLVFASDKATFQTNYAKNGVLPECLQFFPRNHLTNSMLYTGKKLTATEGLTSGLCTESLWPAKFQAELANRIRTLSSSNQQILLRTKTELIQRKSSSKLELTKDLRASWLSLI